MQTVDKQEHTFLRGMTGRKTLSMEACLFLGCVTIQLHAKCISGNDLLEQLLYCHTKIELKDQCYSQI